MNIKSITPKFIRKGLTVREYRITKAIIRNLKEQIPLYEDLVRDYNPNAMVRPKKFYEAYLRYFNEQLIQNEGTLEELVHEMKELRIPLE